MSGLRGIGDQKLNVKLHVPTWEDCSPAVKAAVTRYMGELLADFKSLQWPSVEREINRHVPIGKIGNEREIYKVLADSARADYPELAAEFDKAAQPPAAQKQQEASDCADVIKGQSASIQVCTDKPNVTTEGAITPSKPRVQLAVRW